MFLNQFTQTFAYLAVIVYAVFFADWGEQEHVYSPVSSCTVLFSPRSAGLNAPPDVYLGTAMAPTTESGVLHTHACRARSHQAEGDS